MLNVESKGEPGGMGPEKKTRSSALAIVSPILTRAVQGYRPVYVTDVWTAKDQM